MTRILFKNANVVLEGRGELATGLNVLVEADRIAAVTRDPVEPGGATVIDVAAKTLMPGLIDAHCHITGLSLSPKNLRYSEADRVLASANYLRNCLMAGFTTIREAGGADYTIAAQLAQGTLIGPRMFYCGRALTQTGGGADFRTPIEVTDPCGHVSPLSTMSVIVNGVDKVREAAREELRKGATQVKVFVSGGVVFPAESPTRYEFSKAELAAAVEEAEARGTYVMAHVYTDQGVRRCLELGVRSIEHGNYMSEDTVAAIAEKDAFPDPTFISLVQRFESASETNLPSAIVANLQRTIASGKQVYAWAKKHQVPIGLGTDLWGPEAQRSALRELELRMELDTAPNILRSATTVNAELLQQKSQLGTVAVGAHADLLVVDGNPLADIRVLTAPERNLKLIMKGGAIYKNELANGPSAKQVNGALVDAVSA